MTIALAEHGMVIASDAHPALISLYQAVASGWDPPSSCSKEEYLSAKDLPDTDPLKAFAGFGCAYGGKYFDGYAQYTRGDKAENYASQTRNALLRDVPALISKGCTFQCTDFFSIEPCPDPSTVLYLDPPYDDTTRYRGTDSFDSDRFWQYVALWSRHTDVFVSEYRTPFATEPLLVFDHPTNIASEFARENAGEKLFWFSP